MKTAIHPKYFDSVEIRCSCGNIIIAGSTKEMLKTELCSKCHPFYTGQQKLVDTAGRVDKFQAKQKKALAIKEEWRRKKEKRKPEVYKEKEVSEDVLKRALGLEKPKGKWSAPIGESPAEEMVKEAVKAVKKGKKGSAVKKKTRVKKTVEKKKVPVKKKKGN